MKIVHYCQHVLGIGHFFRSLEIGRALKRHEVFLVTGGSSIEASLPDNIREIRLPGLMMDRNFKKIFSTNQEKSVEQIKKDRQKLIFDLFAKEAPDLFIVELFPFGRKGFRFELDPILKWVRNRGLHRCKVICSLRDILVEKEDAAKYEKRVVDSLNRYFDALLIHADHDFIQLDETFSRTGDISVPLTYTGFVTPKPPPGARSRLRKKLGVEREEVLVVVSAGGGNVGAPLLEAVINAVEHMDSKESLYLYVFTGPYMKKSAFDGFKKLAGKRIKIDRFTPDFLSYLAAADLSVSMAGYNTCMNILAAQVPSLVWPFSQNREQRMRAERLSELKAMKVLEDKDLEPNRLASLMDNLLAGAFSKHISIDLDGAENTAQWIETWIDTQGGRL